MTGRTFGTQPTRRRTSKRSSSPTGGGSFKTIVARYPSSCRRCGGPIAVGDAVRWAPKKGTWHLKDFCGDPGAEAMVAAEDAGETEHVPTKAELLQDWHVDTYGAVCSGPAPQHMYSEQPYRAPEDDYVITTEDGPTGLVRKATYVGEVF